MALEDVQPVLSALEAYLGQVVVVSVEYEVDRLGGGPPAIATQGRFLGRLGQPEVKGAQVLLPISQEFESDRASLALGFEYLESWGERFGNIRLEFGATAIVIAPKR